MKFEVKADAMLMGCAFEFILVTTSEAEGHHLMNQCIQEVRRIERLLTEFSPDSDTSRLNASAGVEPVEVNSETYSLIERCQNLSKLTDGSFDISSGALKKLYDFSGGQSELPSKETVRATLAKTGYQKIKLQPGAKVYLSCRGMRVGFGAIGKGFAADKIKAYLEERGVRSGVVNASGDLTAWGSRADGSPWNAGIADPGDPNKIILWLPLTWLSIATSGDYEQHFFVNGKKFSHNIDPKSGYPVTGIKSVSVLSPSAELSDGLATAITVMGVETGIHFVNQLPQTHCIIIDDQNKIYYSKDIQIAKNATFAN